MKRQLKTKTVGRKSTKGLLINDFLRFCRISLVRLGIFSLETLHKPHLKVRLGHDVAYLKSAKYRNWHNKSYAESVHRAVLSSAVVATLCLMFFQLIFPMLNPNTATKALAAGSSTTWTTSADFTNGTTVSDNIDTSGNQLRLNGESGSTVGVTQVATSYTHTLALREDGTIWAWGSNGDGILGVGDDGEHRVATQVGSDTDWQSVAAGDSHSLALKTDGTLWAWGWDGYFYDSDEGDVIPATVPTQVGTDTDWRGVAAGESSSYAIKEDGTLWAWGWDNYFYDSDEGDIIPAIVPTQVGTDTDWQSISPIYNGALGLKTDGTLWAWGSNSSGDLGLGDYDDRYVPTQIGSDTDWRSVGPGVATKTDGTLWAWGYNYYFYDSDEGDVVPATAPTQVGTDTDWQSVFSNTERFAIKENGTLWTWGWNDRGWLGLGDTVDRRVPTQIGTDTNWLGAASYEGSFGLKTDGTLWAWGPNSDYQLGLGNADETLSPEQVQVRGGATEEILTLQPQSMSVTNDNLALVKPDGTLWVWGNNTYGQLGLGDTTSRYELTQLGADTDWQSVTVGGFFSHILAIKTDGTLWAWGYNGSGQLGLGDTSDRNTPTQVGTATTWAEVRAGVEGSHTLALKTDGTLWAWGSNYSGELGLGDNTGRTTPTQIGTDTDWQSFSAGGGHSLAIKTDHSLWAWGSNYNGQLGLGDSFPYYVPTQVGTDTWDFIAAGNTYSAGIKSDGTLWTWGSAASLGLGVDEDQLSPMSVNADTDWESVSIDNGHSLAIKTDGTLWSWGNNDEGQLGLGDTDDRDAPSQVGDGTNWESVFAAGNYSSMGIQTDGSVWAWGRVNKSAYGYGQAYTPEAQWTFYSYTWPEGEMSYPAGGVVSGFKMNLSLKASWNAITWNTLALPDNTAVKFRVRSAGTESGLASASWSGYFVQNTEGSTTGSGNLNSISSNYWLEVEVTLESSSGTSTPTVKDFSVSYDTLEAPESGNLSLTRVDDATARITATGLTCTSCSVAPTNLRPEVEAKPVGTAFNGSGTYVATAGNDYVDIPNLVSGTAYHFRVRAVDDQGRISAWTSYGTNAETDADFTAGPQYAAETPITEKSVTASQSGEQRFAQISGDKVIWLGETDNNIYLWDTTTEVMTQVTNDGLVSGIGDDGAIDISGDRIVWARNNPDVPGVAHGSGADIYVYNISTATETRITSDGLSYNPEIDGNRIVWERYANADSAWGNIYMYDLSTSTESEISTGNRAVEASISGNVIVWKDTRDFNALLNRYSDIYAYLLDTSTEVRISTSYRGNQPAVSGNVITWVDYRSGHSNVYILSLADYVQTSITLNVHSVDSISTWPSIVGGSSGKIVWSEYDLDSNLYIMFMYDMPSSTITEINPSDSDQLYPDISGNKIVYEKGSIDENDWDIYLYDLDTLSDQLISKTDSNAYAPDISGGKVVWYDNRNNNNDIYSYDLATEMGTQITKDFSEQTFPSISGNNIVWQGEMYGDPGPVDFNFFGSAVYADADYSTSIYMYDINASEENIIDPSQYSGFCPAISGSNIVYQGAANQLFNFFGSAVYAAETGGSSFIFLYNIDSMDNPVLITDYGVGCPAISDNKVIYSVFDGDYPDNIMNLVVADISDPENIVETQITNNTIANTYNEDGEIISANASSYDISGNKIVWSDIRNGESQIFMYDLDTSTETQITHTATARSPKISGNQIVWSDNRNGNFDIYMYDLTTSTETQVTTNTADQFFPNVEDSMVVWEDTRNGFSQIYVKNVVAQSTPPVTPPVTPPDTPSTPTTPSISTPPIQTITPTNPGSTNVTPGSSATTCDDFQIVITVPDGTTKVEISIDGGDFVEVPGSGNTYTATVQLPCDKTSVPYVVRITGADNETTTEEGTINIDDNDSPVITNNTTPDVLTPGDHTITVETSDNIAPVKGTITINDNPPEDMTQKDTTFSYEIPDAILINNTEITYNVRIYDAAGNYIETGERKVVFLSSTQNDQSFLQKVADAIVHLIKMTPPAVANTFPYILFILLAIMASIFAFQARSESAMSKKLLEILKVEKAIYEDKDNFLILSAHYLRTPSTIISGGVDMLSMTNKELGAKLTPVAKSLAERVQSILDSVTNNTYLASLKKPEIEKVKRSLFFSPFFIIPVLSIALVALVADILFIHVGSIRIPIINLIAQGLTFLIVLQVFTVFARRKFTETRNRKEFEQTLNYERSVDAARNGFVEDVDHDIAPFITQIEESLPKAEDASTKSINEGVHRLQDILYKFSLLAASTKSGIGVTNPKNISLTTEAKAAIKENEPVIKEKQLKVSESVGDVKLVTDPAKLDFVISALVSNAVKFTKPKTTVSIEGKTHGQRTEISVSDEGEGISNEEKLHLFKPFTRTTSALDFNYEGLGLSLYLSKILVNSLGGEISLDSEVGKGTRVKVEI